MARKEVTRPFLLHEAMKAVEIACNKTHMQLVYYYKTSICSIFDLKVNFMQLIYHYTGKPKMETVVHVQVYDCRKCLC